MLIRTENLIYLLRGSRQCRCWVGASEQRFLDSQPHLTAGPGVRGNVGPSPGGVHLQIHIILVNTKNSSTTLVISRSETESETHIAWTRYLRF